MSEEREISLISKALVRQSANQNNLHVMIEDLHSRLGSVMNNEGKGEKGEKEIATEPTEYSELRRHIENQITGVNRMIIIVDDIFRRLEI